MKKNNNGFYLQGELHIIFLFCIIVQIDLFIILVVLRVPEVKSNVIKRIAKRRTKLQKKRYRIIE